MESPIIIEHRDALVYLLNEASELEHAIACQYLFAAFGMKETTDEGLTERQAAAVDRWRRIILEIATQEMLHMAQVNNLLTAVGAAPRVGRPNFPQAGRYYPPGVQLALVPFGERALRHFLYLERPEGINLMDAEGFEAMGEPEPLMSEEDIIPRPQDFSTVGHLYRSIEQGFEKLVDRHGEEWLFVGSERTQVSPDLFSWPDLVQVRNLDDVHAAIDTIVEQGEGPRGHWKDAHYGRLLVVLGEYLTMRQQDADFEPSRPVVAACVRHPRDAPEGCLVTDRTTARVLDVFNSAYDVLLHVLARVFARGDETEDQLYALADVAVGLMLEVVKPLGQEVTKLPVGPDFPGATTGPSFEVFYGSGYLLPDARAALVLFHERLLELSGYVELLITDEAAPPSLKSVGDTLRGFARVLADQVEGLSGRDVAAPRAWLKGQQVPADFHPERG